MTEILSLVTGSLLVLGIIFFIAGLVILAVEDKINNHKNEKPDA